MAAKFDIQTNFCPDIEIFQISGVQLLAPECILLEKILIENKKILKMFKPAAIRLCSRNQMI
jgi:hypothetical protein